MSRFDTSVFTRNARVRPWSESDSGIGGAIAPGHSSVDPQREHLDRLLEFDYLTERLAEFFEPDDARLWLSAPHPQLNGERPADLVSKRRQREVLAVIARLQDSAFV